MPIHPFLAHFPIALWTAGVAFLAAAVFHKPERWLSPAWILLTSAALSAVATVVAGQWEIQKITPPLSELMTSHQQMGNLMPWLMGGFCLLRGHFFLSRRKKNVPEWFWLILGLAILISLLYTSHLGGRVVYQEGIGLREAQPSFFKK